MGLVIIKNGNGTIRQISGGHLQIVNGEVITDGQPVREINTDEKVINITIEGDVERLEVDYCSSIRITGNAKRVKTLNGDIEIGGNVEGDCHTNMGSIYRK